MINKDTKYYIYLRSTNERVPVTEQEFKDYYRDIDSFRKKQQRHGRCVCPTKKQLSCDMDCVTCPFRRAGDSLSLNYTVNDEEGNERPWLDDLVDDTALFEEIIADGMELKRILSKIQELMPEAVEIGELRQQGLSEDAISKEIGIGRKTYAYRIKKLYGIIKKDFPNFFD